MHCNQDQKNLKGIRIRYSVFHTTSNAASSAGETKARGQVRRKWNPTEVCKSTSFFSQVIRCYPLKGMRPDHPVGRWASHAPSTSGEYGRTRDYWQ